jgi:hypothetical protein
MADRVVVWKPQEGPQTWLISCPIFEVFFGGARGGGKTEGSVGDWLEHAAQYGEQAVGIFFRRKLTQLEEVIARFRIIASPLGFKYRDQKHEFAAPNGARLKFRYLERDSDADEYQGHSYTRVYVEEATNFPSAAPIDKLRATLRSPTGVPVGMRLTGNPGGPGHIWVKERYIEPSRNLVDRQIPFDRPGPVLKENFQNPFTKEWLELERIFIPSRLSDNPLLMRNDPLYVARLQQQGSAQLVKAWLEGNWDVVLGAFFDCWGPQHVLSAADYLPRIPKDAVKFRAFDWGSARPFSVGWYAVSDGSWGLPAKALVKYREWYGTTGEPNVGLKMDADVVAEGIKAREAGDIIRYGVADPSIFIRDGGPSIAENMTKKGVAWRAGDRKRIVGWDQLRRYLVGENGVPMLYVLDCCPDTIRILPALPHDENKMEDVDTESEDHAGDETRYAVMSRPWMSKQKLPDAVLNGAAVAAAQLNLGNITKSHLDRALKAREEMRT